MVPQTLIGREDVPEDMSQGSSVSDQAISLISRRSKASKTVIASQWAGFNEHCHRDRVACLVLAWKGKVSANVSSSIDVTNRLFLEVQASVRDRCHAPPRRLARPGRASACPDEPGRGGSP